MSSHINDFSNDTLTQLAVTPQLLTGTTTMGSGVDMLLGDGNCWLEVAVGPVNGTSFSVQVQQSTATNAGFTDITGAVVAGTTAQSNSVRKVNFQRDYRYVRVIATISATTMPMSCIFGELYKVL
jgi:hypothetical protein